MLFVLFCSLLSVEDNGSGFESGLLLIHFASPPVQGVLLCFLIQHYHFIHFDPQAFGAQDVNANKQE